MSNNNFRVTFEIEGTNDENVFSISEWLNELLEEQSIDVGHINITEITGLINQKKNKCPLMD